MGLRRASLLALLLTWGWLSGRTQAQEPTAQAAARSVVLDARACSAISPAALHELVALELAPRPLLSPEQVAAGARPVRALLECHGAQAALRVEDDERGERQELTLDLSETVAAAQTRLLALAISELVVSLELEAQSARAELAQPAPTPPAPRTEHDRVTTRVRGHVWLSAGLVYAGKPALLGWSVDAGAQYFFGKLPLALEADLAVARAQGTVEDGRISNWLLMGALALVPTLRRRWIEAGLGAGLRLGNAWLEGTPAADSSSLEAGRLSAFWWGPLLLGSVLVPVVGRWSVRALIDVTYVAKPVRGLSASGEVAYALERFVLQSSLGVAVGF